jgi:Tol biopolymer transport system component
MSTSSSVRGPIIVLIVGVVLIIGGLIATSIWITGTLVQPRPIETAQPVEVKTDQARLAVIDNDRIYTIEPDGSNLTSITTQGNPVLNALIWSRDNTRLIYATTEGDVGQLISVKADDSDSIVLYESDQARVPFYFYGSPDDRQIAFLQSDPTAGDLRLQLAATSPISTAQSTPAVKHAVRTVALGRPDYFSWSPQSDALLLHIGGTSGSAVISTYQLGEAAPQKIATDPANFQAPMWSPIDQRLLYAREYLEGGQLIVADGVNETQVLTFPVGLAFNWSPDGQYIATAHNDLVHFTYNTLSIIDSAGHNAHTYFEGEIVAFFWSPDSQRLAYLTGAFVEPEITGKAGRLSAPRLDGTPLRVRAAAVGQQPEFNFTWHVIDLQTQRTIDLINFAPGREYENLLNYFDQYAQSIQVWSPDSRSLVFVGASFKQERGVYVIDATQVNAAAQFVGPGEFATWSWR